MDSEILKPTAEPALRALDDTVVEQEADLGAKLGARSKTGVLGRVNGANGWSMDRNGHGSKERFRLNSLSDSGCISSPGSCSPDIFSPPTLARCVTDSPSHYFLRGNHRWVSTPLLKDSGLTRSSSIQPGRGGEMYSALGPAKAMSTPLTATGSSIDISGPGSNLDFNSPDSAEINTPVSGVEISHISRSIGRLHTPEKQGISTLSGEEFLKRVENHDDTNQDTDSGIGSLLNDTSGEKNDTAEPPAPVLRRSPRQLTVLNRLDRCSRQKIPELVKSSKYLTPPGCYLGANKLDIIQLLSDRDLWHVLELIFTYIPASDLSSVVLVNNCWRRTLESRVRHDLRRSSFVQEKKLNQENLNLCDPPSRSSSRIAMQEVNRNISPGTRRNRTESTSLNLVTSPSKKFRNRLFSELNNPGSAPTVGDPEVDPLPKFIHCPNCSSTSLVSQTKYEPGGGLEEEDRATCSSRSCGLVFCVRCLFSEHPGATCRFIKPFHKPAAVVTSKKSKARLRRL